MPFQNHIPQVSVLMPVFNCEPYILEAVNSLLTQTLSDIEVIIVDDCSTDGTIDKIRTITDSRIRLYEKKENSGIAISLNIALELARGKYVARMDGDDVSLPQRLQLQVDYLDAHPEVFVLGGQAIIIPSGQPLIRPVEYDDIQIAMMESNPIVHPTVMMRSTLPDGTRICYKERTEPFEDYLLWAKLTMHVRFYNLPECILMYRRHDGQISQTRKEVQALMRSKVRLELWNKIFGYRFRDMGLFDLYWVKDCCGDVIGSFMTSIRELTSILKEQAPRGISEKSVKMVVNTRRKRLIEQFITVPGIYNINNMIRCREFWPLMIKELGVRKFFLFAMKCLFHLNARVGVYPVKLVPKYSMLLNRISID